MKKLDVKAYKLHKLADYIGVIFLVMLLLFIWQLYRGPIAMPFLKPYIIKALNHDDTEYQVTLDSVNLELVRSIKPLRIIATNVVYRKTDDEIIINAPKTSVSFSIKALLRGVIAPSSIEVIKPTVYIFNNYGVEKDKQDQINQKKLEYYFEGMQDFWNALILKTNHTRKATSMILTSKGRKWSFTKSTWGGSGFSLTLTIVLTAILPASRRKLALCLNLMTSPLQ